jgi:hypothetical protein
MKLLAVLSPEGVSSTGTSGLLRIKRGTAAILPTSYVTFLPHERLHYPEQGWATKKLTSWVEAILPSRTFGKSLVAEESLLRVLITTFFLSSELGDVFERAMLLRPIDADS